MDALFGMGFGMFGLSRIGMLPRLAIALDEQCIQG